MKAAVTGGGGFVGGALVNRLIKDGWQVRLLARDPKRLAADLNAEIVTGDLDNADALGQLAQSTDVFFHLAGVTHARDDAIYHAVNVKGAANAAAAAADAGAKLVHASSMSARLPAASPYAQSKFDSEQAVKSASGDNPWLALRLPAIYGPRDFATLPYFKLVKSGWALEPRTDEPARASLLYVEDAAGALIAAAKAAPTGEIYEVGDEQPHGHKWREIAEILGAVLGKSPRKLRAPRPIVSGYHSLVRNAERLLGKAPSLRTGQVNEFFHADWAARENLLSKACDWAPETPLEEGFAKTVRWYQDNGLL